MWFFFLEICVKIRTLLEKTLETQDYIYKKGQEIQPPLLEEGKIFLEQPIIEFPISWFYTVDAGKKYTTFSSQTWVLA